MTKELQKVKDDLITELDKRIVDKIIEKTNADLLQKLITNAETINEAIMIAELGTTYKRTGFHFDKRLEKMTDTIKYFKKNEKLSFVQDKDALTHKLIIGDNYDALTNLLIEYRDKIDVIYIDPPYGKDSMGEFAKTNYDNAITRDNLLSMLYPRLVLARQLLSDNGVIFCSIDDKNQAYVKGLFDEVFGESNLIANLPRVTKKGGKQHSDFIGDNHDYILIYSKDITHTNFKRNDISEDAYKLEDEFVDTRGKYTLSQTLDYDSLWYNPTMDFPIAVDNLDYYPGGTKELHKKRHAGAHNLKDWVWRWSKAKFDFGYANGFVVIKQGKDRMRIYTKTYLNAEIGKDKKGKYFVRSIDRTKITDSLTFTDNQYSNDNGKKSFAEIMDANAFDFPKPVALIKEFIRMASSESSIILDFFSGTGTTGQAVLEVNKEDESQRQVILATNNEKSIATDVTSKRLKRVMTGECYDGTKDFKWNEKNKPLGDNLDVYDIATVANFEATKDITPFDVIDEILYGKEKLEVSEKIQWVCEHFEGTQKTLEK